ncbi:S-adenosyl-L-methionine-dependent methyltransferase [Mycena sanguinolenta]|uniref:S-adenosyl-L-methionine-dependent methyltransferase n=1 Tax=Mycena sanguinolenta TaxID=230812 RepID=A0A8H6Y4C1_9AGAR|nr:S-adenosyl-L-methionine-dependent methyltransferase [Mycena sanguinolenta]
MSGRDLGYGPWIWPSPSTSRCKCSEWISHPDFFPVSPPKNVTFQIESVTNLPSDWTDTFTLVHQRLLMVALQVPDWPQALREIYRVIRPGGYVQLGESRPWYEEEFPDRPCTNKLVSAYRCLVRARNLDVDCAAHMQEMLEEAGFVDIHVEERAQCIGKWAGEDGIANAINHGGVLRGFKTPILEAGGYGKIASEAEYDALIEGQAKEWDDIPGLKREFYIFCARKPLWMVGSHKWAWANMYFNLYAHHVSHREYILSKLAING